MIRASLAVACGVLLACSPSERSADDRSLVRIDHHRCLPSPRLEAPREAVAVMCAEAFVAHNGYTDAPPTSDTTQIAFESIEWEQSLTAVLASRRNTLERYAHGVCPVAEGSPELIVAFRYRGDTVRRTGRAVTMTEHFDSLRVQHQDFILANVADSGAMCQRIINVRGEIEEQGARGP